MSLSTLDLQTLGLVAGMPFVETGTRWGDTTFRAYKLGARPIMTVEASSRMYYLAREHLADMMRMTQTQVDHDINLFYGESHEAIAGCDKVKFDGAFVFLDAHDAHTSPVLEEIAAMEFRPFVVVVDDVPIFEKGTWTSLAGQKITIDEIKNALVRKFGNHLTWTGNGMLVAKIG